LQSLVDALKPIQDIQDQLKGIEGIIPKDQFKGITAALDGIKGITVG
jgi:hypothetical protein